MIRRKNPRQYKVLLYKTLIYVKHLHFLQLSALHRARQQKENGNVSMGQTFGTVRAHLPGPRRMREC